MTRQLVFLGGIMAAIAVGTGAFGAHGLESFLNEKYGSNNDVELLARRTGNWQTAAEYQMYHAIGLILVGLVSRFRSSRWLTVAGISFLVGILLFSGLLYALVLTDTRILGAIVPLGGISFIIGWLALAIGGCCLSSPNLVNLNGSSHLAETTT